MRPPTSDFDFSTIHMARALELAERGRGFVEPNPMVGCVIVDDAGLIIGEGYHTKYGAAHAEVESLKIAGRRARGATMFVTLEPCCHHGKTLPCVDAVIAAGIRRVVVAMADPFPQVSGGGVAALEAAGIEVMVGLLEDDARAINAPYLKLLETGKPWMIAKWAMTLDGKLATRTGDSKWISSEASRALVHQLRGRMDAILVGRGTAEADDPMLTARPPGARVATRVVVDSRASLSSESQLVRTAREIPTLVAVSQRSEQANRDRLVSAGCDLFVTSGESAAAELESLLLELGRRKFTNVLIEGGAILLGSLFDQQHVDEVHVFIAPKVIGGVGSVSAVGGVGIGEMASALELVDMRSTAVGGDLYIRGKVSHNSTAGKPRR